MAVDTPLKRYSSISLTQPWRGVLPLPTGTVDIAARQTVAYHYSGISASTGMADVPGANIRFSAIHVSLPWRGVPIPIGGVGQPARQFVGYHYSGILASGAPPAPREAWELVPWSPVFQPRGFQQPVWLNPPLAAPSMIVVTPEDPAIATYEWEPSYVGYAVPKQTWAHLLKPIAGVGADDKSAYFPDKWWRQASEPCWYRAFPVAVQPQLFWQPFTPGMVPVIPMPDSYWQQASEPVRLRQLPTALEPYGYPEQLWIMTLPVSMDMWYRQPEIPVRSHPFVLYPVSEPYVPASSHWPMDWEISWYQQASEPVRVRPPLPWTSWDAYLNHPPNLEIPDLAWSPSFPDQVWKTWTPAWMQVPYDWGFDFSPAAPLVIWGHVQWAHPFISKYVKKMRMKRPW